MTTNSSQFEVLRGDIKEVKDHVLALNGRLHDVEIAQVATKVLEESRKERRRELAAWIPIVIALASAISYFIVNVVPRIH